MSSSISGLPGVCCPFLSGVYFLALYGQDACVCGVPLCVCVRVFGRACVGARALRIVSRGKILRFKNTFIIIIIE